MIRSCSRANDCKSPSSVNSILSRLRNSFQQDKPCSDRVTQSRARIKYQLRGARESSNQNSVGKSTSEKKLRQATKENNHARSSSVKSLFSTDKLAQYKVIKSQKTEVRQGDKPQKTCKDKLNEEYKELVRRLDHSKHVHVGDKECFLDYKAFIFIMTEMNYLNLWKEDNLLLNDMWKDLGGDDYGGFLKSNLLLFLQIVEGIAEIDNQFKPAQSSGEEREGSEFKRNKRERIFNDYQRFRNNRLSQKPYGLNSTSNSDSIRLAVHRSEQTERKPSSILKETKLPGRDVNKPIKTPVMLKKKPPTKKQNVQKVFRVSFQLERHQPSALRESTKNHNRQNLNSSSLQQLISNIHQIGSADGSQNVPSVTFSKPMIRVPLLSLDVNLGQGRTDKIMIYQGDTSKQVAEELSLKHQLDSFTCAKFQSILENHLKHLLSKIEEVEQLTEDFSCSHRQI